jgi:hypothetical protein
VNQCSLGLFGNATAIGGCSPGSACTFNGQSFLNLYISSSPGVQPVEIAATNIAGEVNRCTSYVELRTSGLPPFVLQDDSGRGR